MVKMIPVGAIPTSGMSLWMPVGNPATTSVALAKRHRSLCRTVARRAGIAPAPTNMVAHEALCKSWPAGTAAPVGTVFDFDGVQDRSGLWEHVTLVPTRDQLLVTYNTYAVNGPGDCTRMRAAGEKDGDSVGEDDEPDDEEAVDPVTGDRFDLDDPAIWKRVYWGVVDAVGIQRSGRAVSRVQYAMEIGTIEEVDQFGTGSSMAAPF